MIRTVLFLSVMGLLSSAYAARLIGVCNDDHDCNLCAGLKWCAQEERCVYVWENYVCEN